MPSPCHSCPLRDGGAFQPVTPAELDKIQSLKRGELRRPAGSAVIAEGQDDAPLYTLLAGWAFRFKSLRDGRRQILNFLLPGDFIGLQQKLSDKASHGVEALTDVQLCVFQRDVVWSLHRDLPSLGYDLTWLAAHEESLVDDNLLSVGRRSALERVAMLIVALQRRLAALHGDPALAAIEFPLTQQHVADALGLSLVHTNKTLRKLERAGLCSWARERQLLLHDLPALEQLAHLEPQTEAPARPLI
ncbi:MAG TPA: Crp/Fnr family transcriptional regulator [Ideonella sp.]|nr:Crp/Fnr family transcriptional regulator [Ideonella sp.]